MNLRQLQKAAPLLNLSQVARVMYGEQANPSYWGRRIKEGKPEISPGEARDLRKALAPIAKLFQEVE